MNLLLPLKTRRDFLRTTGAVAACFTSAGAFAEALTRTPSGTEGPYYPNHLPLDTDNDLIVINNALTPAVGEVGYVSGRVLDAGGKPVRNALVEIWQCDAHGVYLHTGDTSNRSRQDKQFQGFGRFSTGSTGEYLFRTIKPVPYSPRTPHIHFKIRRGGHELITTQLYIQGHPGNEKDPIWRELKTKQDRDAVTVGFKPMPGAKAGEWAAHFDLVLGVTPEA
jgi:protocatechuate 3,4-dioxygenase beta subunit